MEKITDIGQIVALCQTMTNLKLDITRKVDRAFAQCWYEERYLTGHHTRYAMKPGMFINSIEDGKVYRPFNTTDEKAMELMEANENYREYFIDVPAELEANENYRKYYVDMLAELEAELEAEPEGLEEPEAEPEV